MDEGFNELIHRELLFTSTEDPSSVFPTLVACAHMETLRDYPPLFRVLILATFVIMPTEGSMWKEGTYLSDEAPRYSQPKGEECKFPFQRSS